MKTLIRNCFDELCAIFKDPGLLIFTVFLPLLYPLLYAYIYTNEVVREVPIVIVDDSHSQFSRSLTRMLDATSEVTVLASAANMDEAREALRQRKAYGIVHIPSSIENDIWHGSQTTVGLYSDMSSMLQYKAMLLATTNVSLELNRQIKTDKYLPSTTWRQQEITAQPITFRHVQLYNQQGGFAAFLIPPVLMLIIQQTLLLGLGLSMGRDREGGGRVARLGASPWAAVDGKSLAYFTLYMVMAAYMFVVVNSIFHLPRFAQFGTFMFFAAIYILACISLGLALSNFIYRREDSILLYVFMSVPLLFLSGVSWPAAALPEGWRWFSYLFPSTFGCNAYIRLNTMGAPLSAVAFEIKALVCQAAVYGIIAVLAYRRHYHKD